MATLAESYWPLFALITALYVLSCLRVAMHARRTGRSGLKWFFITLFLTAVPAAVVFYLDYSRARRQAKAAGERRQPSAGQAGQGTAFRCPHCGRLVDAAETAGRGPVPTCPRCGMQIDESALA